MLYLVQNTEVQTIESAPVKAMNQTKPHHGVSEKYRMVKTSDIVDRLVTKGWSVSKYSESRSVKYSGYQTHVVQMRHTDENLLKVGDSELRVLIVNDHRGGKSLTLQLGLFRLVCSNGLVVSNGLIEKVKIRHVGDNIDDKVQEFTDKIAAMAQVLQEQIRRLSSTIIARDLQVKLATDLLKIRTDKAITPEMINGALEIRRMADNGDDLWSVFNRIQENLIRGMPEHGIRRVTSPKRDLELNEQFFSVLMAA